MMLQLRRGLVLTLAAAPLMFALPAWSHHSAGAYDHTKEVTVTGTVKDWEWTNPHSFMTVNGADASSKTADYLIEWPSPMELQNRGYRRSLAKVGDKVIVKFHPNKDGRLGGLFTDITTPEGKSLKATQTP